MASVDDTAGSLRERSVGLVASAAAAGAVVTMIAAVILASVAARGSATPVGPDAAGQAIDRAQHLRELYAHQTEHVVAIGLRGVSLLLVIGVGVYLAWIVGRRSRQAAPPRHIVALTVGSLAILISTVVGFFALREVAEAFVTSGRQTNARANELVDASGLLRATSVGDIASRAVFGLWMGAAALSAMRVGLFTRFLGYWGAAGGVAFVLLPIGDAMLVGWIASIGCLAAGYWPGGRPEAWSSVEPRQPEAF